MSYGILFNAHGLVNKSHLTILVLFKGCFFFHKLLFCKLFFCFYFVIVFWRSLHSEMANY